MNLIKADLLYNIIKKKIRNIHDIDYLKNEITEYNNLAKKLNNNFTNYPFDILSIDNIYKHFNSSIAEYGNISKVDFTHEIEKMQNISYEYVDGILVLFVKWVVLRSTKYKLFLISNDSVKGMNFISFLNKKLLSELTSYIENHDTNYVLGIITFDDILLYKKEKIIYYILNNIEIYEQLKFISCSPVNDKYDHIRELKKIDTPGFNISPLKISFNFNIKLYKTSSQQVMIYNENQIKSIIQIKITVKNKKYNLYFDNLIPILYNMKNKKIIDYVIIKESKFCLFNPYFDIFSVEENLENLFIILDISENDYMVINNHLIHKNNIEKYFLLNVLELYIKKNGEILDKKTEIDKIVKDDYKDYINNNRNIWNFLYETPFRDLINPYKKQKPEIYNKIFNILIDIKESKVVGKPH